MIEQVTVKKYYYKDKVRYIYNNIEYQINHQTSIEDEMSLIDFINMCYNMFVKEKCRMFCKSSDNFFLTSVVNQ